MFVRLRRSLLILPLAAVLLGAGAARADDVALQIGQAGAANVRGDALHTLTALQAAQTLVFGRLTEQFAKVMPPAPAGWDASPPESQSLDSIGGGMTVTRGYSKGDSTLNASLVVDNPAVMANSTLFRQTGALNPGWSRLEIGGEDALMRYDAADRVGEIMILLSDRVLLQIEGSDIGRSDLLVQTARGWNIAAIRRVLGGS
ncbi:hypothetical protein GALL_229180 [mine drainage metagenome]|uniref:Uncharacterized protein n=1 Tax=mine drainage metagenome TaxID=410659 RepID=A0A1J5RG71_9ZZZZ